MIPIEEDDWLVYVRGSGKVIHLDRGDLDRWNKLADKQEIDYELYRAEVLYKAILERIEDGRNATMDIGKV